MDYKEYLVECGKKMLHSGLTVETWGNISVRNPENGLYYLTPSGMPYDIIRTEDIVVMNRDMEIVEGTCKPTIEYGMHIGIMNAREDVNAVIHTHPVDSQVFACLHEDIPPVIDCLLYTSTKNYGNRHVAKGSMPVLLRKIKRLTLFNKWAC